MKLYKDENTGEVTRVSSCEECPNLQTLKYSVKGVKWGIHIKRACIAITRTRLDSNNLTVMYHPTVSERGSYLGFLPDCPLEDAE